MGATSLADAARQWADAAQQAGEAWQHACGARGRLLDLACQQGACRHRRGCWWEVGGGVCHADEAARRILQLVEAGEA